MAKCDNRGVNINNNSAETFTLLSDIPEHQRFISNRSRDWRRKNCRSLNEKGYWEDGSSVILLYCKFCVKAVKEMEIERIGGIPLSSESKETFKYFIEKSRLWHAEQLNSKVKEILELKLQSKEKENEILTLKLQFLESKLTEKLTTKIKPIFFKEHLEFSF